MEAESSAAHEQFDSIAFPGRRTGISGGGKRANCKITSFIWAMDWRERRELDGWMGLAQAFLPPGVATQCAKGWELDVRLKA